MKELIEEYGSLLVVWIVGMIILSFGGFMFDYVSAAL